MRQMALILFLWLIFVSDSIGRGVSWTTVEESPVSLGPYPTMTLLGGEVPVLSNGSEVQGKGFYAWQSLPGYSGFIAGNGGTILMSNSQPIKFGKDGFFYSTRIADDRITVVVWQNQSWVDTDVSCPWLGGGIGLCSADPISQKYLAYQNFVVDSRDGSEEISLSIFIFDIAISDFGDIAVSGFYENQSIVSWYNYKLGQWCYHSLNSATNQGTAKIAVEFDGMGNLGVAYVTPSSELRYAYLDMSQDYWADQRVAQLNVGNPSYAGTALAFDRQNQPVIAAGEVLAYNNYSLVPGDANLDGMVDVGDLGVLAANYGKSGMFLTQGDFNSDGIIDVGDLGILAANYGVGTSGADFTADYAKVFNSNVAEVEESGSNLCSSLGLSMIAGLFLLFCSLVKITE
jgi:hypothetical protein